jgi:uncharacterized membrane protein
VARRKPSQVLKQQLSAPKPSLGLFARILLWAFRSNASMVMTMAVLFAIGTYVTYVLPKDQLELQMATVTVFVLLIFGTFFGVIVVTEEGKEYRQSGTRIRMISGAVAGIAIATMLHAPFEGVAFAGLLGIILGYLGLLWAKYL